MLIFIAGPYSDGDPKKREENVRTVHSIAKSLILKGHTVLECHSLEHALRDNRELTHEQFMRQTLTWIPKCDALYLIAHSPGSDLELECAQNLGLQIYERLSDIPDAANIQNELDMITIRLNNAVRQLTGQPDE